MRKIRLLKSFDDEAISNLLIVVSVIIVVFGIIFVGIYVNGEISDTLENVQTDTEQFTVDDPTSNKACSLYHTPTEIYTVRYHNGTGWKTLGSGDYTVSGKVVTILATAMN